MDVIVEHPGALDMQQGQHDGVYAHVDWDEIRAAVDERKAARAA
jgi:hypothetical protein